MVGRLSVGMQILVGILCTSGSSRFTLLHALSYCGFSYVRLSKAMMGVTVCYTCKSVVMFSTSCG